MKDALKKHITNRVKEIIDEMVEDIDDHIKTCFLIGRMLELKILKETFVDEIE
jgi:hypothetical protein